MWIKKKGGKIMGLPPEPSKTCSFRKCNIPLLTIIVNCLKKKYSRYNKCLKTRKKNQWKVNMHTCFHWLSCYEYTENMKRPIAGYLLKSAYIILSSQVK